MGIGRIAALTAPFLFAKALAATVEVCAALAVIAGECNDCGACRSVVKIARATTVLWLMPGAVKPAAVPGLIEKLTELPRGDAFAPAKFEFDSGALGDKEGLAALGGAAGLAVATAE